MYRMKNKLQRSLENLELESFGEKGLVYGFIPFVLTFKDTATP